MKFFIVACLKEYQEEVIKIFKQAHIHVFSTTDVTGFKDNQPLNLLEDWFASGEEKFDSLMLFSFTPAANAEQAMKLIQHYNEAANTDFPVRAFIVPVEKTS